MADHIDLIGFRIIHVKITADPFASRKETTGAKIEVSYEVLRHRETPGHFLMRLKLGGVVASQEAALPDTDWEFEALGEFATPGAWDESKKATLVRLNGGMILYGLARGHLSAITGSFPSGAILLPTLDWRAVVEGVEKEKVAIQQTTDAPVPEEAPAARKSTAKRKSVAVRPKAAAKPTSKTKKRT